jgi:hypothetical protein
LYDSSKISRIIDESDATKVKEMLSQKSVAWLIGEIVQGDSLENWHHFLESIGIEREAIQVIHLSVNH